MYFYNQGEPSPCFTDTVSAVPQNTSVTFDLQLPKYDSIGVKLGYIKVIGSSGNLAGVITRVRNYSPTYTQNIDQSEPGLLSSAAKKTLVFPLTFAYYSRDASSPRGWDTGINILNVGGSTTDIRADWVDSRNGATYSYTEYGVPANAVVNFYMPRRLGYSTEFLGSVTLTSSNSNILAFVSTVKYVNSGSIGYGGVGLDPNVATAQVALPLNYRQPNCSRNTNWITGIQAMNLGAGTTTVNVRLVKSKSCTLASGWYDDFTWSMSVNGNAAQNFYLPSYGVQGKDPTWVPGRVPIPTGWYGSAYVTNSASNKLIVTSSSTNYCKGEGGLYIGVNY
jgi:hypothetical protein